MPTTSLDAIMSRHAERVPTDRAIPMPAFKWRTRLALPLLILLSAAAVLGYSARRFMPAVDVWVTPVVAKSTAGQAMQLPAASQAIIGTQRDHNEPGPMLAQAPGWVEPAPYAITVPALTDGVVADVLALEGDRVEAGQVVVRLIDTEARLGVRAAEAESMQAKAELAEAELNERLLEIRVAESADRLAREQQLVKTGGGAAGELAQLGFRVDAAKLEVESARGRSASARAMLNRREVALEEASLRLERMEVRSPAAGTVLQRLVEPGSRIHLSAAPSIPTPGMDASPGAVFRLYDPDQLQVRAEIPLADSAAIGPGCKAKMTTEAVPDRTFTGTVSRIIHEANIQRNTITVKIALDPPHEALRPDMLVSVRLHLPVALAHSSHPADGGPSMRGARGLRLFVDAAALHGRQGITARGWVVVKQTDGDTIAELRDITVADTSTPGTLEATQGVRAGDRLIVNPPATLTPGCRVHVRGERPEESRGQP